MAKPVLSTQMVLGSDWHFDQYDEYPEMFNHLLSAFEQTSKIAEELKAPLIRTGDSFNPLSGRVPVSVMERVFQAYYQASHLAPIFEITGNHGRGNRGEGHHAESPLHGLENVMIMNEPTIGPEFGGFVQTYFIPYFDKKDDFITAVVDFQRSATEMRRKGKVCLLFTHQGYKGGRVGPSEPGYEPNEEQGAWAMPDDLFIPWHHVFSGHFHEHQTIQQGGRKLTYVGAPIQHNIGDRGQDRGVLIVTVKSDGTIEMEQRRFIEVPDFYLLELTRENIDELSGFDYSNFYVKPKIMDPTITDDEVATKITTAWKLLKSDQVYLKNKDRRLGELSADAPAIELFQAWLAADHVAKQLPPEVQAELETMAADIMKKCDAFSADKSGSARVEFEQLYMENHRSYKVMDFQFPGHGITCITGKNGHGKTGVLKGLLWTLFGIHGGKSADSVINRKMKKGCYGRLTLKIGEDRYIIHRGRKHSQFANSVWVEREGGELHQTDQERINQLVGLTHEAFTKIVVIRKLVPLASKEITNTDKRKLAEEVLDFGIWEEPWRLAKDDLKQVETDTETNDRATGVVGAKISTAKEHIEHLKRQDKLFATTKAAAVATLKAALAELEATPPAVAGDDEEEAEDENVAVPVNPLIAVRERLKANNAKLKAIAAPPAPAEVQARQTELAQLDAKISALEDKAHDADAAADKAHTQLIRKNPLNSMVGKPCPTCKQPVTAEHAAACWNEEKSRWSDEHAAQKAAAAEHRAQVPDLMAAKNRAAVWLTLTRETADRIAKLNAAIQADQKKEVQLVEAEAKAAAAAATKAAILATRKAEAEARAKAALEKARQAIALAKQKLKDKQAETSPYVALIATERPKLDALNQELAGYEARKNELDVLGQRLKMLVKAFGRSGIRSMLFDEFLPEINVRAQEALNALFNGQLRAQVCAQKENQDGTIAEEFNVLVENIDGGEDYEDDSGGEQCLVNFALTFAFNATLQRRRNASFSLLAIDEGADPLDADRSAAFVQFLKTQAVNREILFITHNDHLANRCASRVTVKKVDGFSELTWA